ncbi:MAG: hypothetical protein VKJ09_08210 [Leptolyngbya sp.]|nr:hypothetical protein [Leptolyngbya sp.]
MADTSFGYGRVETDFALGYGRVETDFALGYRKGVHPLAQTLATPLAPMLVPIPMG